MEIPRLRRGRSYGIVTTRTEYHRLYQRAKAKAAGTPIPHSGKSGKSGPSGGKATAAERQRRWYARKKAREAENKD